MINRATGMGTNRTLGHSIYVKETARRLRVNPKDPDALFASAALMAARQQFARAIQLLDMLGELDSEYPGLWRFKARVCRERGDRQMEQRCLAAAERLDSRKR